MMANNGNNKITELRTRLRLLIPERDDGKTRLRLPISERDDGKARLRLLISERDDKKLD